MCDLTLATGGAQKVEAAHSSGKPAYGVGQQFDILTPGSIRTPGGVAIRGYGPPAAIGAKLAVPDRA